MTNHNFIRYFAVVLLSVFICAQTYAQHTTEFEFGDAPNAPVKTMQTNAKALFTEIHRAEKSNSAGVNLSSQNVTDEGIKRIQNLWAVSPFFCQSTEVIERVLKVITNSDTGDYCYQVINVPVYVKQQDISEDERCQQFVIEFTPQGKISDLYKQLSALQYKQIMGSLNAVTDAVNRISLSGFIARFFEAYNRKELTFIEQIYSNDALIITGKVLAPQPQKGDAAMSSLSKQKIEYVKRTKKQYIDNLSRIFNDNDYINITYDDLMISQHEVDSNIYGVLLRQNWDVRPKKNSSKGYHDEGWLFLMIDYKNKDKPLIWVRTWQPLYDKERNPIRYSNSEIFSLSDFPIK
jgi:hypothetical protein